MMAGFSRLHRRYIGVIFFFFSFYISHIMLRVDPSLVVPARIRLPALPSPCLHQIFCFRYSIHSCTTFIHASHPSMRSIHLCATFTPVLHCIYSSLSIYQLRMCYTHSCATFTYALHLCVALILLFSCISYVASYPLTSFLLYHVSDTRLHTSLPVTSPYHVSNRMFSS